MASLRIDTGLARDAGEPSPQEARTPTTPKTRERVLSTTNALLPHIRRGNSDKSPLAQSNSETLQQTLKARHESKQLLSTSLDRLRKRQMPPHADPQQSQGRTEPQRGLGKVVKSFSGRGRSNTTDISAEASIQRSRTFMDDSDEEETDTAAFYTDETCDHMVQLRDVLKVSLSRGWDVFSADDGTDGPSRQDSSSSEKRWRRRRTASQLMRSSRSRSRSASPHRDAPSQRAELWDECLDIMSSVIEEDCRFQVRYPRPIRPTNALQAITLDVAQLLLYTRRHDPRSVVQVGFMVLPAFRTFKSDLHTRLISFFDEGVIGWMLCELDKVYGKDVPAPATETSDPVDAHPMVAITVDEVPDDSPVSGERWQKWSKAGTENSGTKPANAPHQDVAVYQLTSLIQPVLGAIFEHAEILIPSTTTAQRFNRFFDHLLQRKPDAYLDLLGVAAYDAPRARFVAVSLLATNWPKAVGHAVISKPITASRPSSDLTRADGGRASIASISRIKFAQEHPYDHQFVSWQFRLPTMPTMFEVFAPNHCRVCTGAIQGFGLLCPFCMCAVHFDCYDYPQGSVLTEYSLQSDPGMRKVAIHRFSHVLSPRQGGATHTIRKDLHEFRVVNIFNLSLCYICHDPLWGNTSQGMKCGACDHFVHTSCLTNASSAEAGRCRSGIVDSSSVTISYSGLRNSCADFYRDMLLSEDDLPGKSYEELSIFYAVLWTQLHILENGLALGSIHVEGSDDGERTLKGFELHYTVQLLEAYLSSRPLHVSLGLHDYLVENKQRSTESCLFFDWNTLAFVASLAKSPDTADDENPESSALLTVGQITSVPGDGPQEVSHTYEIMSLAHLRDRLGTSLHVASDRAAELLLTHMHYLGLLSRCDSGTTLFSDGPARRQAECSFPLPFGFDVTVEVETLVCTIESCLKDIDLSVNEIGYLLLIRRFWPNGMLLGYTFRRLARSIIKWILSEDTSLAIILRDYVARGRNLPGVRSGEPQAWPIEAQLRPHTTPTTSNGGDYVAGRRALLSRYAAPWMLALHDLDISIYSTLVFELACEHADETTGYHNNYFLGANERRVKTTATSDLILKAIVKLSQASIVFSVFDDLFEAWLEHVQNDDLSQPIASLPRLFTREDGSQRSSIVTDSRLTMGDLSTLGNVNPLQKLISIAFRSAEGFPRGISWLCLFTSSGVDVPLSTFVDFATKAARFRIDLEGCTTLVKAALYASWLRSIGRHEMQAMVATLLTHLELQMIQNFQSGENIDNTLCFVRLCLAVCLLLYGCDRQYLLSQRIVQEEEIKSLPSRRKTGGRASAISDPVIVDTQIMVILSSLLKQNLDELSKLIIQFFYAFVFETPLVEAYEADNFILRNSATLTACVWESYAIQLPELSLIRTSLLVRVLAIDAQPFQSLLEDLFRGHTDWESRMQYALRLFRMILDVISPAFNVEDHQWRPSVIEIFHQFFSLIWRDEKEEIRVAADTWSQTLLPAHMASIAQCWDEALGKAPMAERVRLVNFLLHLRNHFPRWKVLTWETIMETLRENDFLLKNGNGEDGAAAAHLSFYGLPSANSEDETTSNADPEHALLSVTLVSLSLRMIADGIVIDVFSLLRLKEQILEVIGYQNVTLVPSATGHTFHVQFGGIKMISRWADPCIVDLMGILDSSQTYTISCAEMGGPFIGDDAPWSLLIGSPFIDVILGIFINATGLTSLAPLTLKGLLQCHMIIVQKHDFESKPLKHLQADLRESARRLLALVTDQQYLSLEQRQLALAAIRLFTTRWPNIIGTLIFEVVEELAKVLVAIDYKNHPDDELVAQTRIFLGEIMNTFYGRGILQTLFKKPLDDGFFKVLRWILESFSRTITSGPWIGSLSDVLLHDTLSRLNNGDLNPVNVLFANVSKYCEIVHHTGFTAPLFQFVGLSLTSIAQRIVDATGDIVNFSPLITLCSILIEHNKAQSRDFLPYAETLLRVVVTKAGVDAGSICRLLHATASLFRKIEPREQAFLSNHVLVTFLQTVSDVLLGKLRIAPSTLAASVQEDRFVIFAEDGLQYLWSYSTLNPMYQDFVACQAVANLVLQASVKRPQLIEILCQQGSLDIRIWNLLLLAAVRQNGSATKHLLGQLRSFSRVYHASLNQADVAISRAYIAVKLWILTVKLSVISDKENATKTDEELVDVENTMMATVWSELWPPLEAVITSLEQHGSSSNLMALTLGSIADLLLFVYQTQTVLSLERFSHIETLHRLRKTARLVPKPYFACHV
ncbi:hypothetical protein BDY19DRAFT_989447 [Irpex rosettiformis]|uniref:Uncharacterized protein n=1 Tax=Irpex rosettiformis TaxID=378272 RepID=A0ACB8UHY8_9APHY|nr:hypothetical protein BDY19DRAFT_989447 [Irpex rosettiformis]